MEDRNNSGGESETELRLREEGNNDPLIRARTDVPGDEKKETGALQDAEERLGAMWKQTAEWQEVWMDQAASILEKRVIIDGLQETLGGGTLRSHGRG